MIRSSQELQAAHDSVFDGERFHSLVQHLVDVIAMLDASGRIVYVTPSVKRLTGVEPEDAVGAPVSALLTAHKEGDFLPGPGAPRSFETTLTHRDGSIRWVEVSAIDLLKDPSVGGIVVTLHDVTERVAAEEQRRRGEERFRSLVQNSSDMICVVDQDTRIEYVSPAVEQIMGYPPERLLGRPALDLVHPGSIDEAMEVLREALERPGEDVSMEGWVRHEDGSYKKLVTTVRNLIDDPSVRGIVVNNRDITDRAMAEERLRETEGRYRGLVEDVPAVMYLAEFGADGRWHYVSPYIHTLLGWTPEEWVDDPWLWCKSLDPADRERVLAEDAAALQAGDEDSFESEYRMIRRNGGSVWVRDEFRIARDQDGKPIFMRGVILDISHRKEADAALREKDQRFRNIFEHSPMGIGLVDLEGRTIESNQVLRKMLGYDEDEFATLPFSAFTHPDDVSPNLELFEDMTAGGRESFKMEKRFIHKDGRTIWANLVVSLIGDEHGDPAYALGMIEDITERKVLEDQLRQSQKMEAVGRLAGGVAHDFNNLLAVIINCANFLAEEIDPADPRYEDVKDIKESGKRGADLVRQLLAFSRKDIVRPEVVDLNDVVSNMKSLLGRTLGEDVTLESALAEEPCVTKVDLGQIEQILVNLAVNARDAMPDGGKILITTDVVQMGSDLALMMPGTREASGSSGEGYVRLTFTDTGTGMSEEVSRHIFEPFFTTKSRGRGTGLGLATTYGAVQQAGGYISVWSQPGQGTTFTIYLPSATTEPRASLEAGDKGRRPSLGDCVLLVEDDDAVRRLARRMLERNGFRVLEASQADEALHMYEQDPTAIDVVLTDVIMPGDSGRDLVGRLKAIDSGVRYLFMSGYPEDVIAHLGVLEEGVPFLGKPFTEQSLIGRLQAVVDN